MKFPLFGKDEEDNPAPSDEQYAELPEDSAVMRMKVMVEKLDGLPSVDKIMRKVREGNIVIASIRDLKEAKSREKRGCHEKKRQEGGRGRERKAVFTGNMRCFSSSVFASFKSLM